MKNVESNVPRVAVLKYLQSKHGIYLNKRISEKFERSTVTACPQVKVFGVPLQHLPMRSIAEYGLVPCFLVDSCKHLSSHAGSEGLFRKSGSIIRLKALRVRIDKGEDCLSTALPCDVASLVKQLFYELPCPVIPAVLAQAFTRAQRLPTEEERTAATQLVFCLLPEINLSTLRFFFIFLKQVSLRPENKMDSYNLSVVLTPNLFHLHNTSEWSDEWLRLHIAVICTLIENAYTLGMVPDTVMGNSPVILDSPVSCEMKLLRSFEQKSRGRKHLEGSSLSTAQTPNLKKKILFDSTDDEFPRRKRKSFRQSLGMVPSVLFGRCYDSSSKKQDSSPSAVLNRRLSSSARRDGCTRMCKKVKRAMSSAFCCVTPSHEDETPPESSLSSCWLQPYQDTPVGLCLKTQYPERDSAPNKLLCSNVIRTLCCTSATDSPEDKQFLTRDEFGPSLSSSASASACRKNEASTLKNHSSTTSGLEVLSTQGGDAGQQQMIWEKDLFIVQQSDCKLLGQLDLLSSLPAPLVDAGGGLGAKIEPSEEANSTKKDHVHDSSRFINMRGCSNASPSSSSPVTEQNPSIPASSRHEAVTKNPNACSILQMQLSGSKPLNTTCTLNSPKVSVVEHVRKYDGLQVKPVLCKVTRPPLKFHRTPVYQYVKRINSRIKRVQVIK